MDEGDHRVKNFLYTRSYVRKRLSEGGFTVRRLPMRYSREDDRYWSFLVDVKGGGANVVLTCLKDGIAEKAGSFSIMGPRCLNFKVITKSMDVLMESLRNVMEEKGTAGR